MVSAFIKDLIDHKERVAKYMWKAANVLFWQIEIREDRTSDLSLIDLARMYCRPSQGVLFTGQLARIQDKTEAYLAAQKLSTYRETLHFIVGELFQRASVHDNSKFSDEEFPLYDGAFDDLQRYAYGDEEYKACLRTIKPAIKHHHAVNDHHPKFFQNGIEGMHLVQLIEMTCDWMAASERSKTDIATGLQKNKEHYGIDDEVFQCIQRTVNVLRENKE
jgi:hypothetical protein